MQLPHRCFGLFCFNTDIAQPRLLCQNNRSERPLTHRHMQAMCTLLGMSCTSFIYSWTKMDWHRIVQTGWLQNVAWLQQS